MKPAPPSDDVISELGLLRRYARSLTRDRDDAEDLVQDTLLRALERRASFRTGGNLRGWLLAILHNVFVDGRRSRSAARGREAEVVALTPQAAPAGQEEAVRLGQIRAAFFHLPEEQRAALHLVAIEGLDYQAAADVLGVPIGTLMSRIGRARAALRALEAGPDLQKSPVPGRARLTLSEAQMSDPVTELDLDAYVDDQLTAMRRIEVEAHLADHPALAARLMGDLRIRDELRLALAGEWLRGRPETTEAARRLTRALARDRSLRRLSRLAAAVTLVGAGWLAHAGLAPTSVTASPPHPAYVADALQAHGATVVRAAMTSQPETPWYDAREIRSATGIVMPRLPAGWRVRDAQIFPSPHGPSVELALGAGDLGAATLFAVRPGGFDVVAPARGPEGAATSAYFQIGDVAYVLVAETEGEKLVRAAADLARSLR